MKMILAAATFTAFSAFAANEPTVRPLSAPLPTPRPASVTAAPGPDLTQVCAQAWKDTKNAKATRPGETWPAFLARCQSNKGLVNLPVGPATVTKVHALPTQAPKAARVLNEVPSATASVRAPTTRQLASQQRMKTCGAEWRRAKAAGKIPAGQTWPKYWSACNKRLKKA